MLSDGRRPADESATCGPPRPSPPPPHPQWPATRHRQTRSPCPIAVARQYSVQGPMPQASRTVSQHRLPSTNRRSVATRITSCASRFIVDAWIYAPSVHAHVHHSMPASTGLSNAYRERRVQHHIAGFVVADQPPPLEHIRILPGPVGQQSRRQHVLVEGVLAFFLVKPAVSSLACKLGLDLAA